MQQEEIWKDIPDYEGYYQVSNLGRVKSLERKCIANSYGGIKLKKEKILSPSFNKGYLYVVLYFNRNKKTKSIHQLVAMAFLGHTPCGYKIVVDHINNIKTDNRIENLQLISNRENSSKDKKNMYSKYTGVSWDKSKNKWKAQIRINGESKHLGIFENEIDASNAYNKILKTIDLTLN